MLSTLQALKMEHVVNIKELQKSPSRSLRGITRVLKGSMTLGYFLSAENFENFVEDLEAAASTGYRRRIAVARREGERVTLKQLRKRYAV